MKDAQGHGSSGSGTQRSAAVQARHGYSTRVLGSGKVAVVRNSTGTQVARLPNQASADYHVQRQLAEDQQFRQDRVSSYLADRASRPAPAPAAPSNQLNLFGAEAHLRGIAAQHGIDTSHLTGAKR